MPYPFPSVLFPLLFLTTLILLFSLFSSVRAQCYYPNGTLEPSPVYQPCGSGSGSDTFTMCCASNGTNGAPADKCLNNGLCSYIDLATGTNQTWRESCTDPSWRSPSCVKFCLEGSDRAGRVRTASDAQVTDCGDGTYCCGVNRRECCASHQGVYLVNGTTASSLPSATSTTSATPTTIQSFPTNDDNTPSQESSDQKRKVGVGVGLGVGGSSALAAVVVAMCIRRRRRKLKEQESRRDLSQEMEGEGKIAEFDGEGLAAELEADLTMWGGELDAAENSKELEGTEVRAELR